MGEEVVDSSLSRKRNICAFESDILHILLEDSIMSISKRFQEIKNI